MLDDGRLLKPGMQSPATLRTLGGGQRRWDGDGELEVIVDPARQRPPFKNFEGLSVQAPHNAGKKVSPSAGPLIQRHE